MKRINVDLLIRKKKNIEIKLKVLQKVFFLWSLRKNVFSEQGRRNRREGKFDIYSLISDKRKLGYILLFSLSSFFVIFFPFLLFFERCYFTMLSKNRFNLIRIKASSSQKAPPRLRASTRKLQDSKLLPSSFPSSIFFTMWHSKLRGNDRLDIECARGWA